MTYSDIQHQDGAWDGVGIAGPVPARTPVSELQSSIEILEAASVVNSDTMVEWKENLLGMTGTA